MNAVEAAQKNGKAQELHDQLVELANSQNKSKDAGTFIPATFMRVTVTVQLNLQACSACLCLHAAHPRTRRKFAEEQSDSLPGRRAGTKAISVRAVYHRLPVCYAPTQARKPRLSDAIGGVDASVDEQTHGERRAHFPSFRRSNDYC